jgi:transposase InsO family protein
MRFAFIAAKKAEHRVTILCRCMRVTRSGFYAWRRRGLSARAQRDLVLRTKLRAFHAASGQVYGRPRLWKDRHEDGEAVSEKRVRRLMREEQIQGKVPKRFKQTTDSQHDDPIAANVLDRDFTAAAPNQRWVGDTTEFMIGENAKLYLAAILDLYSRFVVGWAISAVNDRRLTLKALEMAVQRRCPAPWLLHHSDRGCTYTCEDYQRYLATHGITCSMSRRADCYDNAVMESFFATVKKEKADRFPSYSDAKMALLRLHRSVLQPTSSTFDTRPDQSGQVRARGGGVGRGRCHPCGRQERAHRDLENRTERGFPQRPHPSALLYEDERRPKRTTLINLSTDSDQVQGANGITVR